MREHKYRAWDGYKMHENVDVVGGKPFATDGEYYELYSDREIENGILIQYTGFKDKHGTEGYHKDIVKSAVYETLSVIEWDEECGLWSMVDAKGNKSGLTNLKHWEIIGNTRENPELLEK